MLYVTNVTILLTFSKSNFEEEWTKKNVEFIYSRLELACCIFNAAFEPKRENEGKEKAAALKEHLIIMQQMSSANLRPDLMLVRGAMNQGADSAIAEWSTWKMLW